MDIVDEYIERHRSQLVESATANVEFTDETPDLDEPKWKVLDALQAQTCLFQQFPDSPLHLLPRDGSKFLSLVCGMPLVRVRPNYRFEKESGTTKSEETLKWESLGIDTLGRKKLRTSKSQVAYDILCKQLDVDSTLLDKTFPNVNRDSKAAMISESRRRFKLESDLRMSFRKKEYNAVVKPDPDWPYVLALGLEFKVLRRVKKRKST